MSIVQQKLQELRNFQEKWGEELLAQLGIKPGSQLGISFEPNIELAAMPEAEPLPLGIYSCVYDSVHKVEVIGQNVQSGIVLLDTGGIDSQLQNLQVMSYPIFNRLFYYVHPTASTNP